MWGPTAFSMDTFGTDTDRQLGGPSYVNAFHNRFPREIPPLGTDTYMASGYFGHGIPPELARNRQFDPRAGHFEFERSGMPPSLLWEPESQHWARHMKRMAYGDRWGEELERERHAAMWNTGPMEQPSPHAKIDFEYVKRLEEQQKIERERDFQQARSKSYNEELNRFTGEGGHPAEDRQGDIYEESQTQKPERAERFPPQRDIRGTDFGYGFHDIRGTSRNTWRNFGKRGYELPYYSGWWRPRADIMEEEGNIRLDIELPGVPKDNIRLIISDDFIEVSTLKPLSHKEESAYFYQNERHFGNFYRKLWLPKLIDPRTPSAILEKGVLKITCHLAPGGIGNRHVTTTEGTRVGNGGIQGLMRVREQNQEPGIRNPKTAHTPSTGTTRPSGQQIRQQQAVGRDSANAGNLRPDSSLGNTAVNK